MFIHSLGYQTRNLCRLEKISHKEFAPLHVFEHLLPEILEDSRVTHSQFMLNIKGFADGCTDFGIGSHFDFIS